jgi:hypothetical protein
MNILVCGGRDYGNNTDEMEFIWAVLKYKHEENPITHLVNGGAKGADSAGHAWAAFNGIDVSVYEANWARYGNGAGMIRNLQMLTEEAIDLVIAFPGGNGTADMVRKAIVKGVPVYKPKYEDKYRSAI